MIYYINVLHTYKRSKTFTILGLLAAGIYIYIIEDQRKELKSRIEKLESQMKTETRN